MTDREFDQLLEYLRRNRGFDFTAYKRTGLRRRIDKRIATLDLPSYASYIDHLEVDPAEYAALFDALLINVTGFFRDPQVWELVAHEAIPRILDAQQPDNPIRVWSAGCSSGEEAYTLAMLLAERLGADEYRARVKIYATDLDGAALAQARQATYTPRQVEAVPEALLGKYFEPVGTGHVFDRELRSCVIFGRHDLAQDAPISRVDLLTCRNTLMYFNTEAQDKILTRLRFALNDHGFLLLGRAEMLFTHADVFTPVDLRRRLFAAVPRPQRKRERLLHLAHTGREDAAAAQGDSQLREVAFDVDETAQLVVDAQGLLVMANEHARRQFGVTLQDVGRPLQELEISHRPAALRPAIERAMADRRPVSIKQVESPVVTGGLCFYDVVVVPLASKGALFGVKVTFLDVTRYHDLQRELNQAKQELETAYEELQSTNEELETTNEELQSTVEELETTNEELQSTNEELETMNEELQSTNEELHATNEELHTRTGELNDANIQLEAILASFRSAVVVVNGEFLIQLWNPRAEDMWGLRASEVLETHLLGLDIGLPVQELRPAVREALHTGAEVTLMLPSTNRRGRPFTCRVTVGPLRSGDRVARGAILTMEDDPQKKPEGSAQEAPPEGPADSVA